MITFSRADARRFRALLRRSVLAEAPRGRYPPITATVSSGGTILQTAPWDVGLVLRLKEESGPVESISFPGQMLADIEGAGDGTVTLETLPTKAVRVSWHDGPVPRTKEFSALDAVESIAIHDAVLRSMSDDFIRVLNDACHIAARNATPRFALTRIQLRGKAGEIVATDGKELLIQGGFEFPFTDDLLVPALPVFGAKELRTASATGIARLKDRIVIRVGPWQIHMAIDKEGRYPDFRQVIPRGQPAARLILGDADAEYLVDVLPGPPAQDRPSLLTLDLNDRAVARVKTDDKQVELELCGATVTGKPILLCVERPRFFRVLQLGFRSFDIFSADKPIVSQQGNRLLVLMTEGSAAALSASRDAVHLATNGSTPSPRVFTPERSPALATSNSNGHATESPETLDPLAEAEAIKSAVQELLNRSARLVNFLKQFHRQRRVVESALSSLKSLQLGA